MDKLKASVIGLSALVLSGCYKPTKSFTPSYTPQIENKQEESPRYIITGEPLLEDLTIAEDEAVEIKSKVRFFDTLTPEYKALLDTLSWAEYTSPPCLGEISSYQVLVLGKVVKDSNDRFGGRYDEENCRVQYFTGFEDHPKIKVGFSKWSRITSDAAGRYQFMGFTYDRLKALDSCGPGKDQNCGLFDSGFTPDEQDEAAVFMVNVEEGVTQEMLKTAISDDYFKHVWKKLAKTWASLPYYNWKGKGVGYYKGQRNSKKFKDLRDKFMDAYGRYKDEENDAVSFFFDTPSLPPSVFIQNSTVSYGSERGAGTSLQLLR